MDDNKPITKTIGDEEKLKEYLNCLTKYRLRDGTEGNMTLEQLGQNLSDRVPLYSNVKNSLITRAKQTEKTELKKLNESASIEDMLKMAVDYLSSLNDRLGSLARQVLSGCDAHIKIEIRKDSDPINYSSSSITYDGSRFVTDLQVKKDIGGVVAIAQELVNTALCVEHKKQSTAEDERHDDFAEDSAKTFVGLMLVQYVGEKENLSQDQIEKLQVGVLQDTTSNIISLEKDEKIVRQILEVLPDISQKPVEAMTPDDYKKIMQTINESPEIDKDMIKDRMEEVAENRESAQYLNHEVTADLAVTLKAQKDMCGENPEVVLEETTKSIVDAAIAGNSIAEVTGIPVETVVNVCSNKIDKVLDSQPQEPLATAIDNARERDENENVMVMERKPQNPYIK